MKRYLMALLITGVVAAFATTVYADWAEVSESSSRDVESFGDVQAEHTKAKQVGDIKLRQLSEQAETLIKTGINTATTATDITSVADKSSSVSDSSNSSATDSAKLGMIMKDAGLESGVGSMGSSSGSDNPAVDNPPSSGLDAPDIILDAPKDEPVDIIPLIPGGSPDLTPPPREAARTIGGAE